MLLFASTATPEGPQTIASVAIPPSPSVPAPTAPLLARQSTSEFGPLPATVFIVPLIGSTRRTRSLHVSLKYSAPSGPYAAIKGKFIDALVAAAPSPAKPSSPLPAMV